MEIETCDRRTLVSSEFHEEEIVPVVENETRIPRKYEWICIIVKNITLEPCIFLFFMAMAMEGTLFAEIMFEKTCLIHLNYSSSICDNISEYKDEQIVVEQETNHFLLYNYVIKCPTIIIFILFIGAWSDKHGRKIPLILSFIGCTMSAVIMWVNTTFWSFPPEYILFSVVPVALTGGMSTLMMMMYSYLSDITEIKSRTARIAFFDTFLILGPTCGLLLSNYTKAQIGFSGTYIITGAMYASCIIYIIIRIEETRGPNARHDLEEELVPKSDTRFRDLFNCENVRQTFKTTFKRRANHGRTKIILLMISICLMVCVFSAINIEFLYMKLKFKWSYEQYVYWLVASIGFSSVGMAIIFPVLSYKLGVRDEFLGLIASTSVVVCNVLKGFAVAGYQMYITSGIAILSGVPIAASRSMVSKIVPAKASGKIFSVLGSWEAFLPLLAAPLYTFTYNNTISYFPGIFFFISAALYSLTSVTYIALYWLNRRDDVGLVVVDHED